MKFIKKITIIFCILFSIIHIQAKSKKIVKTVTITVQGNCQHCKTRIENALNVKYIKKATYNLETKQVVIKYRADKIEEIQLHNIIAGIGHDTDKVKATNKVYGNLPQCCKYRNDEEF